MNSLARARATAIALSPGGASMSSKVVQKAASTSPWYSTGTMARTFRARWIRHLWRRLCTKTSSTAAMSPGAVRHHNVPALEAITEQPERSSKPGGSFRELSLDTRQENLYVGWIVPRGLARVRSKKGDSHG